MRPGPAVHLALVHGPVVDRTGRETAAAVTHLDVHDLARLARTYNVAGGWLVCPQAGQRAMVERVMAHWREPAAQALRPDRFEALRCLRVVADLDGLVAEVGASAPADGPPLLVVTSARARREVIGFRALRQVIFSNKRAIIIAFGTGWGLADRVMERADLHLEPISADTGYNHLSVRSAMAIVVDRLLGSDRVDAGPVSTPAPS